jgi:TatD DNase family protein
MWIDAHAHLFDVAGTEMPALLQRARAAGVGRILNTATSLDNAPVVISQCSRHSMLAAAIGISPFDGDCLPDTWEATIEALCDEPCVVGIGEVGLDSSNPCYPPLSRQEPVFERLCALAVAQSLPLIVHSRGAENRVIDICREQQVSTVVFHCFTGDLPALRTLLDRGWFVSFTGIITFKKNTLADLVRFAPLDRLLIETDTPYLAPVPYRGKPNEPAFAGLVGQAVAAIKNIDYAAVEAQVAQNFASIFGASLSVDG